MIVAGALIGREYHQRADRLEGQDGPSVMKALAVDDRWKNDFDSPDQVMLSLWVTYDRLGRILSEIG
jgi:hypothetical protein